MSHEIGKQSETVHLLQHFANARKVQGGAVLFRFRWVAGHASGLIIPEKVARPDDQRRSGRDPQPCCVWNAAWAEGVRNPGYLHSATESPLLVSERAAARNR
jgi:hypothetical protein